jgi:hypothetical protein
MDGRRLKENAGCFVARSIPSSTACLFLFAPFHVWFLCRVASGMCGASLFLRPFAITWWWNTGWGEGDGDEIKRRCFRVMLRWAASPLVEGESGCVYIWSVWSGLVALQRVGWARGIDYTASGCYTFIHSTFYLVPLVLIFRAGCGQVSPCRAGRGSGAGRGIVCIGQEMISTRITSDQYSKHQS